MTVAFLPNIYHPAAIDARSLMAQWGIGDPYGYRRTRTGPSDGAAPAESTTYSPYGYPTSSSTDTGTGRVTGGDAMENVSGWAARQGYTGAALGDLVYNPSLVLPDVIGKRAATGPVGEMLTGVSYDPRTLYLLSAGNKRSSLKAGPEGYANWLGTEYYPDMAAGMTPDLQEMLRALENPRQHSALGEMFSTATPTEQVNLYQQFLYDAAMASGLGPEVAMAIIGAGTDSAMLAGNKALSMNAKQGGGMNIPRRLGRGLGF